MMHLPHRVHAFRHVRNDTIDDSDKLIGCDIEPFFLLRAFDDLSMLNGAPDDGVNVRHTRRRVEVNRQSSWYMTVAVVCILLLRCDMDTGTDIEIVHVLVYVHFRVMCAAAGGECTVVASSVVPRFAGVAFRPCCSSIVLRWKFFWGAPLEMAMHVGKVQGEITLGTRVVMRWVAL
jgi:hypothetical protein